MKNIFSLIKKFNSSPSKYLFKEISDILSPNRNKCRECYGEIYFKNNRFRFKNNGDIEILGPSFNTTKKHGESLEVCEDCLRDKFPEYDDMNKGRIFNTLNKITRWAFSIKNEDLYKTGVTKQKLTNKYGEEEGLKRWEKYRKKQSDSNKFEYKNKKYGWSKEDFKKFNKSRAVTVDNMIKKYGKEGLNKYDNYIKKQRKTKSFDYMVRKFGYNKAIKINKSKALTKENFTRKYGKIEGIERYKRYINNTRTFYSNISQKFFDNIDKELSKNYTTYYGSKNIEFGIMLSLGYVKVDYFIKELNIAIEFNGNLFHANPKYYNPNDTPNPWLPNVTAKEIWNKEDQRIKTLFNEKNIKTIVIWEDEAKNYNINKLKEYGILF